MPKSIPDIPYLKSNIVATAVAGLLLLSNSIFPATAQEVDDRATQLWADYNPTYALSRSTQLYGDIGVRTELGDKEWFRFIARPSIRKEFSDLVRVAGGVGSLFTWNKSFTNRWEIRPWAGVRLTPSFVAIRSNHFIRLEYRADYNTDSWDSRNSVRLRYRLRLSRDMFRSEDGRYWRFIWTGEMFIPILGEEGQFREQFRVGVGLERPFGPYNWVRFDLTWQKEGRPFQEASTSALYLRIRYFGVFGN